jgi:peptidoglycan/LPS O-acetylase OafA/YrhL
VLRECLRRRQQAPAFGLIAGFAVRRLCRMLPAMWLSIAVAIAVVAFLPGAIKGASAFHNDMMVRTLSLGAILGDLVAGSYYLNPVLWSIQVELVMILPLVAMFWLSTRLSAAVSMAIFAILAAGSSSGAKGIL